MDGGVPIKAPVAGHRHGPHLRGRQVHRPSPTSSAPRTPSATWTSRSPAPPTSSPPCSSTPRSTACPPTCWPPRSTRPRRPGSQILDVMNAAIAEPRPDVGADRPEDHQLRDPDRQDRRGHRAQGQGHQRHPAAETGADISVDDDGMVGTVTIGSTDNGAVAEAERQIKLILNPPTADVGAVYQGEVVNITKFGAFVNILPGRDGLVHISKMGGGKRIDKVEDVLPRRRDRGEGRRRRPERQGQPVADLTARRWWRHRRRWRRRSLRRVGRRSRLASGAAPSEDGVRRTIARRVVRGRLRRRGPRGVRRPRPGAQQRLRRPGRRAQRGPWRWPSRWWRAVADPTGSGPIGPTATRPVDDIQVTTLANGLRVVTERDAGGTLGGARLWVGRRRPGRATEDQGGTSHFLEHLLFKGTAAALRPRHRRGGRRRGRRDERLHRQGAHRVLPAAAGAWG